jgi:hypothetical protein
MKAPDRQAETAERQAETADGQAETAERRAETADGQAETAGGRAETSGDRAETAGGQAETAGGQAETAGGRAKRSGGRAETDGHRSGLGGAAADQEVSVTVAVAAQVRRLNKTSFQLAIQAFNCDQGACSFKSGVVPGPPKARLPGWGLRARRRIPKSAVGAQNPTTVPPSQTHPLGG